MQELKVFEQAVAEDALTMERLEGFGVLVCAGGKGLAYVEKHLTLQQAAKSVAEMKQSLELSPRDGDTLTLDECMTTMFSAVCALQAYTRECTENQTRKDYLTRLSKVINIKTLPKGIRSLIIASCPDLFA